MKIRLKGIQEVLEWSFESVADRLGIDRRHILFGGIVLLISALLTALYIYQKNWVITGKRAVGRSEQLTISLNGEDSALQEMSNEIRDSILDTPMSAASSQSMAQSASAMNAARSDPQNTAAQSASANSANSSSTPSAAGASSSFSPSVSQANSSVLSGQARAENSQSMIMASSQSRAQSASMSATRSNPQDTTAQSASANSAAMPNSASTAGSNSFFTPSVSSATASVKSGEARAETSQSMSTPAAQSLAQSASGMNAARSNPQDTTSQSASANSANTPNSVSASGTSATFSPSVSGSQAAESGVMANGAQAEASRGMSGASSQSLAQAVSRAQGSARNSPRSSTSQASGSARGANTSSAVSGSGTSGSFSPSVSGSRAAASGVMSNGARAEAGRGMSGASLQSLAQAASGAKGAARNSPSSSSGQARGSARGANTSASVSGSGPSGSFSPSVSGSGTRAAASGVMANGARAEVGRGMSGASSQSLAQLTSDSRGTARGGPGGNGRLFGSARGTTTSASISGSGTRGSFSPSVSGSRAAASGVMTNRARAEVGRGMSGALPRPSVQSGRSRLGGGAINTDQVMMQAGSQSMARPVSFGGTRSRPRSAYVARTETSVPSTLLIEVVVAEPTNSQSSFVPTVIVARRTVPTVEEAWPEQPKMVNPYELRTSPELRADFVKQKGGGPETEAAVARALEWLKRNQWKDGRWNHRSGHSTAATGLAMLAYMGWGAKHNEPGRYQETLAKAVDWMLSKERNGDLRYRGDMYDHGIAAIALAEAYNLTKDERLREPVKRLVAFTIRAQNKKTGGWRYKTYAENPRDKGDLSVSGWQLMALKSARLGGMDVPNSPFLNARKFIDNAGVGEKGFQYRPGRTPSLAMIAEGLFCEQILRGGDVNPQMEKCIGLIQKNLPSTRTVDYYYWYYGSLAMRQTQGTAWEKWNEKLKPILLRKQQRGGTSDGSWDPEGKNGSIAGRCVTTALAALSLEVYYRYLPLASPEWLKNDE